MPRPRAPECAGCHRRLAMTPRDFKNRTDAQAIAYAIERGGWDIDPPRCIPCQRADHRKRQAFARRYSTTTKGLFP